MRRIIRYCLLFFFLLFAGSLTSNLQAQFYSVQTNTLKLATTTFNAEGSMLLSTHWTLNLGFSYNPWNFNDTRNGHGGLAVEEMQLLRQNVPVHVLALGELVLRHNGNQLLAVDFRVKAHAVSIIFHIVDIHPDAVGAFLPAEHHVLRPDAHFQRKV